MNRGVSNFAPIDLGKADFNYAVQLEVCVQMKGKDRLEEPEYGTGTFVRQRERVTFKDQFLGRASNVMKARTAETNRDERNLNEELLEELKELRSALSSCEREATRRNIWTNRRRLLFGDEVARSCFDPFANSFDFLEVLREWVVELNPVLEEAFEKWMFGLLNKHLYWFFRDWWICQGDDAKRQERSAAVCNALRSWLVVDQSATEEEVLAWLKKALIQEMGQTLATVNSMIQVVQQEVHNAQIVRGWNFTTLSRLNRERVEEQSCREARQTIEMVPVRESNGFLVTNEHVVLCRNQRENVQFVKLRVRFRGVDVFDVRSFEFSVDQILLWPDDGARDIALIPFFLPSTGFFLPHFR
jgi:hypothetical protein